MVFEFFCYFIQNFLPRVEYERNLRLKFFLSFSAYLLPFWPKIMPERGFWIFLIFYSEFSSLSRVWTEFGTKFFPPFVSLSHPVLAKNNSKKRFFSFLNFFAIFFRIFLPRSSMNWIRDESFFSLFLSVSHPVLEKNNAGKWFFNFFEFFCYFIRNFPARVENERNSGLIFFFSLSQPISSRFG